ncbi:BTAD domain-containing putative transcriptional regulator [Dactylosporangium sp. AC04546]|uniref:BTAD domain-containing putative transcriptional regulator n=1 Tax=Dactylosporangium sp. AC04546 TaxID=2862460 RepID=UPI001EDEEAAE|nr:BTAD domain-containing putative transcriptional regulator [Dactylosporangium sp. AC04546]WVK86083.1 BTAD domain-containing putative transcriptional regulator [Dactylosporangium sp. AC04546]
MDVDVRVLGRIEVVERRDDEVVPGRRVTGDDLPRRARQVLGVLAARHDRVQSKDALADAVWGEDLPGNHAAALEHYVSVLRRTLQPGVPTARSFIVTRAGGYVFATDRASLDLAELRTAARIAQAQPGRADVRELIVRLAVDLPFGEDEYAEWAAPARVEVRAAVVGALLDLAETEAGAGTDPAHAQRLARDAIELEPFSERAYRVAMRASAALGRPDEVIRWYDQCRRALGQELGIAPSGETTALLAQLRDNPAPAHDRRRGDRRRPVPAARQQRPAAGAGAAHDRDDQGTQSDADEHNRRPGERGAGETGRLAIVRELRTTPATSGAAAGFVGREAELRALAYGPGIVHVVGPAGAGKSAALARLRETNPATVGLGKGPGPGGALRLGWLRTVLQQLNAPADAVLDAAMAERRHLTPGELDDIGERIEGRTIAVDDAEHLDADSVAELRWLRERGVRVVVSYRYPSGIAGRPLGDLGGDLVLRLAPLGAGDLDAATLERSGGIPALVDPGPAAEEVAMHLARQRTRWMPPAAWEILRLTAALGSLRVEQVAAVGGLDVDEVLAAVDQLVHAHLLVDGPGGHVRHRSDLVRSAVAAQVSAAHGHHLRVRLTRT